MLLFISVIIIFIIGRGTDVHITRNIIIREVWFLPVELSKYLISLDPL